MDYYVVVLVWGEKRWCCAKAKKELSIFLCVAVDGGSLDFDVGRRRRREDPWRCFPSMLSSFVQSNNGAAFHTRSEAVSVAVWWMSVLYVDADADGEVMGRVGCRSGERSGPRAMVWR